MKKKRLLLILFVTVLFYAGCGKSEPMKVNYIKNLDKAKAVTIQQDLLTLNNKVQLFFIQKSRYPANYDELIPYLGNFSMLAPDGGKYIYLVDEHKFIHKSKEK